MKRLVKKSEFFNAFKDYANDYCEVFKNPTSKEYSELRSLSGDLRGIITGDGTIYAWDAEFLHDEVCRKMGLSMSDLHLVSYGNVIGFYCDDNFKPFEYLKKYKSQIEQFAGTPLESVKIEFSNLFIDLMPYAEYMEKMENNSLQKIVANNKRKVIEAENVYLKNIIDPIVINLSGNNQVEQYMVDFKNRDFAIVLYDGEVYTGHVHQDVIDKIDIDPKKPCCFANYVSGKDGNKYVIMYQFMDNIDEYTAAEILKKRFPEATICIEDDLGGEEDGYVIKVAEYFDSFKKNNTYTEVYKNPTSKELGEILRNDPNNSARGCIDGSDLYIWSSEILHYVINQFINISAGGVRFVIENGYNISFSNYTSDSQLFKELSKTKSYFESCMGLSADRIAISSDVDYNFNYATLQDYLDYNAPDKVGKISKIKRLVKQSDKTYSWDEVCQIQSDGQGRKSSLPFGDYGNFELKKININELKDYFMTYDEMVSMDMDEDLSIFSRIYSAIENGEDVPPIVVDKNMKLIDGSHRLSALYEAGYRNIDAFVEQ